MKNSLVSKAYLVPGQPHVLLASEQSPAWKSLHDSYAKVQAEIEASDADLILYFSTQWLSVLGYMFQADARPEWVHVDQNWYEYGSMPYQFTVDVDFAKTYAETAKNAGLFTKLINYRGFPVDTGTIVAQKLLNPHNKLPAAMVSCNIYAEMDETLQLGELAATALAKAGKRAVVVLVSGLSNRFEVKDINPLEDKISSAKDDEWNRKILELLGEGRLEDVSQCARDFAREANGDMGFKGIWWLNGLCGKHNKFSGKVFDYQPVWGTGNALVGLTPLEPIMDRAVTESAGAQDSKSAERVDGAKIQSSKAAEPVGAYPHARREGEFLFLSGVGPRERGSKKIPGVTLDLNGKILSYDIEVQCRAVIENVRLILEDAGATLKDVVDIQVFLTNIEKDFAVYNNVYAEYFKDIGPTRTTLGITALPTPIAIEFKVTARLKR